MPNQADKLFSVRQRLKRWKLIAGSFHLITLSLFVMVLAWVLPQWSGARGGALGSFALGAQTEKRQLLIEALDKLARYQKYHFETNGRYTRDISRLALPDALASGSYSQLTREYEISVLELWPNRFLLLASGITSSDRVTVDDRNRITANFVLPSPSRAYLLEEADRMVRLKSEGREFLESYASRFWKVSKDEAAGWVALGERAPVLGERRENAPSREVASIFSAVSEQLRNRVGDAQGPKEQNRVNAAEVLDWLTKAHQAQHIHFREKGRYAAKWEDLDKFSSFGFGKLREAKNIRISPLEVSAAGYRMVVEGTEGELMGEQFLADQSGAVRQVRYTEALINQLQKTTDLLGSFQINPIKEESPKQDVP